jgi:hypothetical protein
MVIVPLITLLSLCCTEEEAPLLDLFRDRPSFTQSLARVQVGMSRKEVLAILGKPGKITKRACRDSGGNIGEIETFGYGCAGPTRFPTLGQLTIVLDQCSRVSGNKDKPPSKQLISEGELRQALSSLSEVRFMDRDYDPMTVVRAVNRLRAMGKPKAIAGLREYLRVATRDSQVECGVILVMWVLFELPTDTGHMPSVAWGDLRPPPPIDLRDFPRYPILLVDDIPFVITNGWLLTGFVTPPQSYIDRFEKDGELRHAPLKPSKSPLRALERFSGHRFPYYAEARPCEVGGILECLRRQAEAAAASMKTHQSPQ